MKRWKSFRHSEKHVDLPSKNVRHVYCWVCVATLKTPFFQRNTTRCFSIQQSFWMFLLDLRQFDLEEMGWLLNYLTSVGANAQKGWQEG